MASPIILEAPDYTDGHDLPISVVDFKTHARIVTTNEDSLIEAYLRAATLKAELIMQRSIGPYTWQLSLDRFPYKNNDLGLLQAAPIELRKGPIAEVLSVTYLDPNGNMIDAVEGTDYQLDLDSVPARVAPVYNNPWPPAQNYIKTVTVDYTAGYVPCGLQIPEDVLLAIRLMAASWYDLRNALVDAKYEELPMPFGASALLGSRKVVRL